MRIIINGYARPLFSKERHGQTADIFKEIMLRELDMLSQEDISFDLYNMGTHVANYVEDNPKRNTIFLASSNVPEFVTTPEGEAIVLCDKRVTCHKIFTADEAHLPIIVDGITLATYDKENRALYVLHDIYDNTTTRDRAVAVFGEIMKEYVKVAFGEYARRFEWNVPENRENLSKQLKERFEEQSKEDLRRLEENLRNSEGTIERAKRDVITHARLIPQYVAQKEVLINSNVNFQEKAEKELDTILKHPKVTKLEVKNGEYIIHTSELHIHADDGKVYYGGLYRIHINPKNADVKFFGDTKKQGIWSDHDPHPHVSGSSGKACLGNTESTILELCTTHDLFPLVNICIDFLESANTHDSAGEKVYRWDLISADGEVSYECESCGEFFKDELTLVYTDWSVDDDEVTFEDEARVCNECLEKYYTFVERVGGYMHNSEVAGLMSYFEDCEDDCEDDYEEDGEEW